MVLNFQSFAALVSNPDAPRFTTAPGEPAPSVLDAANSDIQDAANRAVQDVFNVAEEDTTSHAA